MIDEKTNPVEWVLLLDELIEAQDHLNGLIDKMNKSGNIDDMEYGIYLGHIYSHLNRAWNSRNRIGEQEDGQFDSESEFPNDLKPV